MIRAILLFPSLLAWVPPSEYFEQVKSVTELIRSLKPDLDIVDPFDSVGRDGTVASGAEMVVLSPNTLKDIAAADQELDVFAIPYYVSARRLVSADGFHRWLGLPIPDALVPLPAKYLLVPLHWVLGELWLFDTQSDEQGS